jgi:hypothetical protein
VYTPWQHYLCLALHINLNPRNANILRAVPITNNISKSYENLFNRYPSASLANSIRYILANGEIFCVKYASANQVPGLALQIQTICQLRTFLKVGDIPFNTPTISDIMTASNGPSSLRVIMEMQDARP